jgi:hypothetical protein
MEAYTKMNDLFALNNLIMQLNSLNTPMNTIQQSDNPSTMLLSNNIIIIDFYLLNNLLMTNKLINSYNPKFIQNNQTSCVTSFTICNSKQCGEMRSKMDCEEVKISDTPCENREQQQELTQVKQNSNPDQLHESVENEMEEIFGINRSLVREENNLPDKRKNSKEHPEKKSGETSNIIFIFRGRFLWQSREILENDNQMPSF